MAREYRRTYLSAYRARTLLTKLGRWALLSECLSFARPARAQQGLEGLASDAGCAAACSAIILLPVVLLVANIAMLVWVARDAKARGMDAVIWMLLVMGTSIFGLLLYILSRPTGDLTQCSECNNPRLDVSARCPHCGNS